MPILFATIATALSFAGNSAYITSILRGTTKPHLYTRFVSCIVDGIVMSAMVLNGAGWGSWPTIVNGSFSFVIFFLALGYGYKHRTRSDMVFLIAALGGVVLWFLTSDATLAVVVAVAVDIISQIPTYRKTWIAPQTETWTLYAMNWVRHALTLSALSVISIPTALHSSVMLVHNTAMLGMILIRKNPRT